MNGHGGKLQQVWFSTNGLLAFARFGGLPGNYHYVRVWEVPNTNITGGLNFQVVSVSSKKEYCMSTADMLCQ